MSIQSPVGTLDIENAISKLVRCQRTQRRNLSF